MTLFRIVALYTALNLLLAPFLMFRVGGQRLAKKVDLGDGGDDILLRRIRAHGNFTENAPLALIGLFALAFMNAAPLILHVLGAGFFIGRVAHAMGMAKVFGQGRLVGTLLTLMSHLGTSGILLYLIFTFKAI